MRKAKLGNIQTAKIEQTRQVFRGQSLLGISGLLAVVFCIAKSFVENTLSASHPLTAKMADRFPSLEDIDVGQTEVRGEVGGSFLDRERALLGDDADLFATSKDQRAIVETVEDGDGDLLGGGEDYSGGHAISGGVDELDGFESSFPAIDTQNNVRSPRSWAIQQHD
jgi:hypothetical protein